MSFTESPVAFTDPNPFMEEEKESWGEVFEKIGNNKRNKKGKMIEENKKLL